MFKKDIIFEYLKIILKTLLVIFITIIILLAIIQRQVFIDQARINKDNESVEYSMVGVLIEKNKYLEEQDPKNYRINLKLGELYEIYKNPKEAEINYKKAIQKAPYGEFTPNYKLAMFYALQNKLDSAQQLMDSIDERPDKRLIKYKANVYTLLGDQYYNQCEYLDAIEKYEKALSYYRIIKDKNIKAVTNSIASAYVYNAEMLVDNLDINGAIKSLERALKIIDAPIIKYKLALLIMSTDPKLAYKYFEEVCHEEPTIINSKVYYDFLQTMSQEATLAGNVGEANLYSFKAKKFKEFFQSNILSFDDVNIKNIDGKMKFNKWKHRYNIVLDLQLINASAEDINSLYVYVEFKDGKNKLTDYLTKVADEKTPLLPNQVSPLISIKTLKKIDDDNLKQNISASIYVSKKEDSNRILLKTIEIEEMPVKVEWWEKFL